MTLELIKRYWQEACDLTAGLHPDEDFTTTELIAFLNERLPPDFEKITKTKVNYLRDQGILKPAATGGEIRTSWRYSSRDVRRMLTVELLKKREDFSVQEIKGWLWSVEETQTGEGLTLQWHQLATQE